MLLTLVAAILVTACGKSIDGPAPNAVASITVEPMDSLTVGSSRAIKYTLFNGQRVAVPGDSVSVSSADAAVARIDAGASGRMVTGVKSGRTEILVRSGGKEGRITINVVNDPPSRIQVEPMDSVTVGSSRAIKFTLFNAAGVAVPGDSVTVSSANTTIARVERGAAGYTVTGVKAGSTEIVVQSGGKEGRATVKVVAAAGSPALLTAGIRTEPEEARRRGRRRSA